MNSSCLIRDCCGVRARAFALLLIAGWFAMPRKTLVLGGARYALPVIDAAHELDAKVVTCDYLPHNYAHAFSVQYKREHYRQ